MPSLLYARKELALIVVYLKILTNMYHSRSNVEIYESDSSLVNCLDCTQSDGLMGYTFSIDAPEKRSCFHTPNHLRRNKGSLDFIDAS